MSDNNPEVEVSIKNSNNQNNKDKETVKYMKQTDLKDENESNDPEINNNKVQKTDAENENQVSIDNNLEIKNSNIPKIEKFIDDLGITRYNLKIYTILSLFFLADGAEMIVISLVVSKLGKIWNLSDAQKGMTGSAVFVGFFFGALLSGKLADNRGRKPIFVIGSLLMFIFATLSAFSPNYTLLLIFRALNGLGIGLSIPSSTALTTEITPSKYRSLVLNLVFIFFSVGEIFTVLIAREVLDKENGWRYLLGYVAIPTLLVFIVSLCIYESPKYYLAKKEYDKAFNGLNRMLKYKGIPMLTDSQKDELIKENEKSEKTRIKSTYTTLFKKEFIWLMIKVSLIYYICSFIYYGMVYIFPQIMERLAITNVNTNNTVSNHNSTSPSNVHNEFEISAEDKESIYKGVIISAFSEIPSNIIAAFLANFHYLGRKGSLTFGLTLTLFGSILCCIRLDWLILSSSLLKAAITIPFNIIYLYTSEAFPTNIRSIAHGVCNSYNRLGGITTPIVSQYAFSISNKVPFYLYAFLAIIGVILTILLPFDTLGRQIN